MSSIAERAAVKGVTFFRVKLHPIAECQHVGCGWSYAVGGRSGAAVTVRAKAERHVQATGHIVNVTIRDITEYAPEHKPEAKP